MNQSNMPKQPPDRAVDEEWMHHAIALARRGVGRTRPNPPVGAVIVRDGRIIGEGWHRRAGNPHAEIEALSGVPHDQTRNATLYVTLEPCSTHGRTPPCTEAILKSGISRVVVSVPDPNPKHRGRGLRLLKRRGVAVTSGICRQEGETLLAPFARWITTGLPFVTLKMGMTLDGRIADRTYQSRWITGTASRGAVHQLRRQVDAILVGANTVKRDNPSLRWSRSARLNPKRMVLDARGELPHGAKVLSDGQSINTIVVTTAQTSHSWRSTITATGARVWVCGRGKRIDLQALLKKAGAEGLLHVLCEGGGELAAELIKRDMVDDFWFFVAPFFLGGGGVPVVGGNGWLLKDGPSVNVTDVRMLGRDVLIHAQAVRKSICLQD